MTRLLRGASYLRRSLLPQLQKNKSIAWSVKPLGSRKGLLETSTQLRNFATKGKRKTKSDESDSSEESMSQKDLALKLAMDQITTSFGKGSIMWLGRSVSPRHIPVVSTGSFGLDVALGIGGLPKGRVVEIYGPEASGKTTLALHVIAEAQRQGDKSTCLLWLAETCLDATHAYMSCIGYCVFVDAEHALDPALAEAIGVDTQNLLLSQPDCGEQALSLVDTLIRSGSVDVVVVDSVAALVPKGELDGEMGDAHVAMQARLMSQALRKLSHSLSLSQTILIFTNQVRAKISTFGHGGATEVTCGGNALKFYASVRIDIRRTGMVKKGDEIIGSAVSAKIVKNKHAPPFKTVQLEIEFGKGISRVSELINLGCKHKLMRHAGSFYFMNDQTFHGVEAFKSYLSENSSVRDELETKLRHKLLNVEPDSQDGEAVDAAAAASSSDVADEEEAAAVEV